MTEVAATAARTPNTNHTDDPHRLIDEARMSCLQIIVVTLCIFLNALDGFDVLSISFAAPGISSEWGIDRAALGIVLSMELIGMAIGSVWLGSVADRVGRRPTILACLLVMTFGMLLAATSASVEILSLYRFLTGLGIGGMLAATNAMVAEFSNARRRNLCVTLMATGYPLGAVLGGAIATRLLQNHDWRSVFAFGALLTSLLLPFVWYFMPESISFLCRRRPAGALEKINKSLQRMNFATIESLPQKVEETAKKGFSRLFSPQFLRITVLLCVAYFFHIMTFYFILKWIPKIVVDMGFTASSAGSVLVWANVGGMLGSVLLGILTHRFSVRSLAVGAMLIGSLLVWLFGTGQSQLSGLSMVAAAAGFFTNSAIVGLYAIFVQYFPTEIRAGGTGFVIGVGRGGAALGPVVAGFLFQAGFDLEVVALCMGAGSIIGAVALLSLPAKHQSAA